ncbi:hypothetical protein CYY_008445 [Polysphondylium violaceum]|uniref:Ubiquitin-like domain-containing protein n=1 Tax=Polysphondylium violaceum TaxID=133409 RepID=A0A8J4PNI4_9MYCE|nr:hypothetical protein CYY_008445 [Polysphondylium violaceum]
MIIHFLTTVGTRIILQDVEKQDTIESLKIKLYRNHSDRLPIPKNFVIEQDAMDVDGGAGDNPKDLINRYAILPSKIIHPYQIRLIYLGKQLNDFESISNSDIPLDDSNPPVILIAISPFKLLNDDVDESNSNTQQQDNNGIQKDVIFTQKPKEQDGGEQDLTNTDDTKENLFTLSVSDKLYHGPEKFQHVSKIEHDEALQLFGRVDSNSLEKGAGVLESGIKQAKLTSVDKEFKVTTAAVDQDDVSKITSVIDGMSLTEKNQITVAKPALCIDSATPKGETRFASSIVVTFNRSVIPLNSDASKYPVPFEVSPTIPNASWAWTNGTTCTYATPDRKAFPNATTFTVTPLLSMFKDVYQEVVQEAEWTFTTSPPYVLYANHRENIFINFSHPVNISENDSKHFELSYKSIKSQTKSLFGGYFDDEDDEDEDENDYFGDSSDPKPKNQSSSSSKPIAFHFITKLNEEEEKKPIYSYSKPSDTLIILALDQEIPYGSEINLTVKKGIKSKEGPNTFESDAYFSFMKPEIKALEVKPEKLGLGIKAKSFVFTSNNSLVNPFLQSEIKDYENYISIEPKIDIRDLKMYGTRIEVIANYILGSQYTCTLSGFKDIYGSVMKPISHSIHFSPKTPTISFLENRLIYNLDPLSKPMIKVQTTGINNFQVTAYKINSEDYIEQIKKPWFSSDLQYLSSNTYTIKQEGDYEPPCQTEIDLAPFFGASNSCDADVNLLFFRISNKQSNLKTDIVLQYSPNVITLFETDLQLVVFLTNAHTKQAITENVTIQTFMNGKTANTTKLLSGSEPFTILTKKKSNLVMATVSRGKGKPAIQTLLYVEKMGDAIDYVKLDMQTVSDCPIYRPGDTVNLSSIAKVVEDDGVYSPQVVFEQEMDVYVKDVSYTVYDSKRKVLAKGVRQWDESGAFTTSFDLPLDMFLGNTVVEFVHKASDTLEFKFYYEFRVEEFKRKQLLVQTNKLIYRAVEANEKNNNTRSMGDSCFVYEGEPFSLQVEAKAYSGETLPGTIVDWMIYVQEAQPYSSVLAYDSNYQSSSESHGPYKYTSNKNLTGKHHLDFILDNANGKCLQVRITGTIRDNNQNEPFREEFIVIPKNTYICVSKEKNIINVDEPLKYSWFVTDLFGNFSSLGSCFVKIKRVPWEEDLPLETVYSSQLTASEYGPLSFEHILKTTGKYLVQFEHVNGNQPPQLVQKEFVVLGEQTQFEKEYIQTTPSTVVSTPPPATFSFEGKYSLHATKPSTSLQVKLDKELYNAGDSCRISIDSKIVSGHGYILVSKNRKARHIYPFTISNGVGKLTIKLSPSFYPKVNMHTYVEGTVDMEINETKISRISSDSSTKYILFDTEKQKLDVSISSYKKFQSPNEKSSVSVLVKDYKKNPLKNARVTLAVVDKSLLDLDTKPEQDPIDIFYSPTNGRYQNRTSLLNCTLYYDPPKIAKDTSAPIVTVNEIKIRYFSGRILIFKDMTNEIMLSKLQAMIQERDGLPPTSQRLFYLNKQIPDTTPGESTLESLGIPNGATLNLVIRLSGGSSTGDDKPDPLVAPPPPIRVRDNFNPVAAFQVASTNGDGEVVFNFTLPDNLTKYRIIAYADHDASFGKAFEYFTTSLPIMVRVNPSRFLRYNDQAQFPISVQNLIGSDLDVSIAFRSGHCDLDGHGYKASLAAYNRLVVPASLVARVSNIKTNLQVIVKTTLKNDPTQEFSDALNVAFPIPPLPIQESSSTSHSIDEKIDAIVPLDISLSNIQEIDQNTGGLSINLSNTPLLKMVSSMKYLMEYEHCCSEQISSKLLALTLLTNNPSLFENNCIPEEYSDKDKVKEAMLEMIKVLKSRLSANKGFKYWDGDSSVYEFVSIYVYWVLHIIHKEYAFEEAGHLLENGKTYLSTLTKASSFSDKEYSKFPVSYLSTKAFACLVHLSLVKNASDPTEMVKTIVKTVSKDITKPNEVVNILSYILPVIKTSTTQTVKVFNNLLHVTGRLAYFDFGSYQYGFYSQLRTTALFTLEMIKTLKPTSPLLVKLVNGIVHHTLKSHYTTLDYSFSLYALSHYAKKIQSQPDLSASLYLNNHIVDQKIELDSMTKNYSTFIPIRQLMLNQGPLFIEKTGPGSLFYDISLSYAPKNIGNYKVVDDRGLAIKRTFVPIKNKQDVVYHNQQNLVEIASGCPIKVVLDIQVSQICDFVVIQDHLPAGLEPTLKPTKSYWMSHINQRERGIEVFANSLNTGHYTVSYICNSSTIGNFFSPACLISEMYNPTTFGRSQSTFVHIK